MPWTGGFPIDGNKEGLVIPTGFFGPSDDQRRGVYVANVMVTGFEVFGSLPDNAEITFSCQANVRWRKKWVATGGLLSLATTSEELVINASLVPVNVSDSINRIRVTSVRWTVWRLT